MNRHGATPRGVAEEVFDLLDRRKYSSAMILTSNTDIEEWPHLFPDPVPANASIDRIFDGTDISIFKGKTYRLKGEIQLKKHFCDFDFVILILLILSKNSDRLLLGSGISFLHV